MFLKERPEAECIPALPKEKNTLPPESCAASGRGTRCNRRGLIKKYKTEFYNDSSSLVDLFKPFQTSGLLNPKNLSPDRR
jgi:hypothetical protein